MAWHALSASERQTLERLRHSDNRAAVFRNATIILRWLTNIRKTIAGGYIRYICMGDTCTPGDWARARPGAMYIKLCRQFWFPRAGVDAATQFEFQAQTLIHETSHIYYGTEDSGAGPGAAECISQFVAVANNGPIDNNFIQRCRVKGPVNPGFIANCVNVQAESEFEGDFERENGRESSIFDWFPSWFPGASGGSTATIVDRTAFGKKENRKGKRDIKTVYALVLHQTAFSRGNHEDKYDGIPVHFVILPDGTIVQLHPEAEYLWSSNGLNKGSVAVEFVGNFRSVRGRHYKPEEFGCHAPTAAQIQAGRDLIKYLKKKIGLTHVLAHRQSSGTRENDPGPEVWYGVGQWGIDNLGLKDGGPSFKVGSGNAIPDEWRQWGSVARSHPVHSSTLKACKTLYGGT